ncbi:hypothetical protein [Bacillus infantis]|uniref:hypothetical protein n=1 Tax=Bacillus infantis TaxID=324767 RepID=UPI00209FF5A1|nr:hypothetical protein [Bacillus infantis]MCP1159277.1 hypothetical protein [Bacillus infantis]
MLFDLGDVVTIKASGKTGEITQYRHEIKIVKGVRTETHQYYVQTGTYMSNLYSEDELKLPDSFDNRFEEGLMTLLIDVNLKSKNLAAVKDLYDRRKKYTV